MNTMKTITIGRIAHASAWDVIEETAMHFKATPVEREGYEAWRTAKITKSTASVTATLEVWKYLLGELVYRWEVSGGGGNPYGIERGDLGHYRSEREACARAVERVSHVVAIWTLEEADSEVSLQDDRERQLIRTPSGKRFWV